MKTLLFLLMGVFCFAHSQTKNKEDSIVKSITEKVNAVNKINKENEILVSKIIAEKKAKKVEMIAKNKSPKSEEKKDDDFAKSEALKPEPTKQVIEVDFKMYKELIKGGFFYRIFHKENYKVKYYKIVNDEKVYLN